MVAKIETQLMLKSKTLKLIFKILLKQDAKTIMQGNKKQTKPCLNTKCKPMSQPKIQTNKNQGKNLVSFGLHSFVTFDMYVNLCHRIKCRFML